MVVEARPLVSIITPCYNSGRFLEACIQSVLAQDYACVEHIIQDGVSTDETPLILERYKGQVDWLAEPDRGQADGLDRALKRCRGDFILVLNADDVLLPQAASWAVVHMARHPEAAVIYGDLYIIDGAGEVITALVGPAPYDFEQMLCVEQVLPAQAAFIRRSCLEQVGLGADPNLDTCPDYEMWVRLGLKFPMRYAPGFVSRYRWHPHPDGAQPRSVKRFIQAKRLVMDRLFDDPATPLEIRRLRRRAYSGLAWWGALQAYREGDWPGCLRETLHSLWLQPRPARIRQLLRRLWLSLAQGNWS